MHTFTPIEIIAAGNTLGEGILWDSRRDALWWTDIQRSRLQRHDLRTGATQVMETPERVGSFGLVAGSERLIIAFESGIALYDPGESTVDWLARPEEAVPGVRFNDGRVDRRGRFWSGTMVEDSGNPVSANLYCIEGRGAARCMVRDVRISNGLCMSPDGSLLYFADSPKRTISVYELIEPEGSLGARHLFAQTPEGSEPDGAAVDAEGCIWSAHWGAGSVVRYTPEGRIDQRLEVPASQPSCVCFGGPDLDLLFVTTARQGLDATRLKTEPHAGDVFVYRTGAQGLPEQEFLL